MTLTMQSPGATGRDRHPDPDQEPQFYESVATRRLVAFIIDAIIVGFLSILSVVVLSIATLGLALLFSFLIGALVDFVYRSLTISAKSATLGMQMMGIELRAPDGNRFDASLAMMHTGAYMFCLWLFVLHIVSIVCMIGTRQGSSLPDLVLGTVMINRPV